MNVYRISSTKYSNDLSGFGAAHFPGRWNGKDVYMLYTAGTPSLAMLETIVHIPSFRVSAAYNMITIEIPDMLVFSIEEKKLPGNWNNYPAPDILKEMGNDFIREGKFLTMRVPSAIMPEEYNYLLNPHHPAFAKVKIIGERPVMFDSRLIKKP